MMFGFRDEFNYLECSICGCIQILEIPENLSKYYPANYLSFNEQSEHLLAKKTIRRRIKKLSLDYQLGYYSPVGKLLSYLIKDPVPLMSMDLLNLNYNSKILDIGSGTGTLLLVMYSLGFKNLTGVDPFIQSTINYKCGVSILKKHMEDIQETYDFIMLHHAFEHMDQPLEKLQTIYKLLNHNSHVLIRIPVASSYASRKYKADWVQLDAPRHFFIHTINSIRALSERAGFILKEVQFDSDEFQFMGSEMYLRDIPLKPEKNIFDAKTIRAFSKHAQKLNATNDGDQARFYLYKE
jgi:2-polyprenyl-3-methyl-5-hydroxy-6-metoxy-1,4-benzoquinol methylase